MIDVRFFLFAFLAASVRASVVYSQALPSSGGNVTIILSSAPQPRPADVLAWGVWNDSIPSTGWATLEVHTALGVNDSDAAYAAGYLEAATSVQRIFEYVTNAFYSQSFDNGLGDFLDANLEYTKVQVAAHAGEEYWHHVGMTVRQLEGLLDGYAAWAPPEQALSRLALYAATLSGDLDDLNVVFNLTSARVGDGHCSVLVKCTPGGEDLLVAHTTWSGFNTMTRVYKTYDFPLTRNGSAASGIVPARTVSFSSYPAALFSDDDWLTTSAGLVATETTIANHNSSLWSLVTPHSVLEWARSMVATRLARSGPEWAFIFLYNNSGTYNNEWMIVDYKKFTPGAPLQNDTLWVIDQFPGPHVYAADHTGYLRNASYWASYNRVSNPVLFDVSNQSALVAAYGQHFTYGNTSRARIFDRDHAGVVDAASLRQLMRYNDFQHDPDGVQGCADGVPSGSNAIAERGDLTPSSAVCVPGVGFQNEGATDLKYTTAALMTAAAGFASWAQSGPTYDTQPAFDWRNSTLNALNVPHAGQPDLWRFPYVLMQQPAVP